MVKTRLIRTIYLLLVFTIVFSSVIVLSGCELNKDKATKKDEIESYLALKDKSNYSDENWNKMRSIVNKAKKDINRASAKSDIALLACDAKVAMDGVQPKQSDTLQNGAYCISDLGWEKYVRDYAKDNEKDESWVENLIQEKYNDILPSMATKEQINVIIEDNQIVISSRRTFCYKIHSSNNIYKGTIGDLYVEFWAIGNELYVCQSNTTRKYNLDNSYQLSDELQIQLDAPKNVDVWTNDNGLDVTFQWAYESTYGTLGACVEFKNSQNNDFEVIKYETVWMNMFTVQLSESNLTQGENIVRFYHIGGPELRKGNLIRITEDSAYITYRIVVDGKSVQVEEV